MDSVTFDTQTCVSFECLDVINCPIGLEEFWTDKPRSTQMHNATSDKKLIDGTAVLSRSSLGVVAVFITSAALF